MERRGLMKADFRGVGPMSQAKDRPFGGFLQRKLFEDLLNRSA
jgi:hypothetical protein